MKKYQILEHISDLKIRAFGKTKEKLFLNMLKAMAESQKARKLGEKATREIRIKSSDLATLLVDFLNEVLYLNQVNKENYFDVKFKKFTDTEIEGELIGQKIERLGEDIKAATYHNLDLHQKEDKTWEATVLFDV